MKKLICSDDLVKFGYQINQARKIIRIGMKDMIEAGYGMYTNKRMDVVSVEAVDKVTVFSLCEKRDD